MMPNLAPALILSLSPAKHDTEKHFLGKVVLWVRQQIRYNQTLNELHKLDERDLDDINVARVDFPELAWRHATGAEPLRRSLLA